MPRECPDFLSRTMLTTFFTAEGPTLCLESGWEWGGAAAVMCALIPGGLGSSPPFRCLASEGPGGFLCTQCLHSFTRRDQPSVTATVPTEWHAGWVLAFYLSVERKSNMGSRVYTFPAFKKCSESVPTDGCPSATAPCEKVGFHLFSPSVSPELRPGLMENVHFFVFSGSAMGLSPGG